jgi:hypothetical protein
MAKRRNKLQATYQERVDSKTRKDVDRLMADGVRQYESGMKDVQGGAAMLVSGAKKIFRAGRKFSEASDINQLEFKSWDTDTAGWQKEYMRRQKVEAAIKVFHACEEREPSSLADCRAVIQPCLIASGALPEPRRVESQTAHTPPNYWTEIVNVLSNVESVVDNIKKEKPMEDWDVEELEKFIRATSSVSELNGQARELLKRKSA